MRKSQISPKKSIPSYIIIKLKKKKTIDKEKTLKADREKKTLGNLLSFELIFPSNNRDERRNR